MYLKIVTTPHSITVCDDNSNTLRVIKTNIGIEYHSAVNTSKVSNKILALQNKIKHIILNPEKDRDNYKVRFAKLAKFMSSVNAKTFQVLINNLEKA